MAKASYLVNWRLQYDGLTYEAGDVVRMDTAIAEPLLDGVLSARPQASDTPDTTEPTKAASPKRRTTTTKDVE